MTATIECEAGLTNGWLRMVWRRISAAVILAALASCGGHPDIAEDLRFYNSTWLFANPDSMAVDPGQDASAVVTVGEEGANQSRGLLDETPERSFQGVSVVPPTPGVTLTPIGGACTNPSGDSVSGFALCRTFQLNVSAAAIAAGVRDVILSAIWFTNEGDPSSSARTIERVETFRVSLPPVVVPDFQVAVNAAASGVYGTRATLPVSITRTGGFAEDVTLVFDGLASGIVRTFPVEPMPTDLRNLELQIPARYAGGGRVDLRVTATASGGLTKVVNFSQYIEPLFKMFLQPQSATLTTAAPLRVEIGLKAGELLRSPSIGPVELSISPMSPLAAGVDATFLDDPLPVVPVLPVETVSRILQLVTDGRRDSGGRGPIQIRGTARGVPPDLNGVAPFIEVTLNLTVEEGNSWQFVGNNLTYGIADAEAIGMSLQSDNRPVVAWLEGGSSNRMVFMRRFDGTTFAPSPPRIGSPSSTPPALRAPSGGISIAEASFALSSSDAGLVAFSYEGGARLALGRADRASVDWSVGPPIVVGDPADATTSRVRSPRIATGPADAVVVSYIREANAATTSGGVLQVMWTGGSNVLHPLPTSLPGGALNASPVGSVVRHATALALRADGNPWVAWIEEPTNTALPNKLWLRAYDGNDWGPAIAVPTSGTPVGTSVQLLVEPSGMVVVAWLEGSPAQLKLLRYDPSSQSWTALSDTGNGRGSLNVTATYPALDVHLAREPGIQGRLLVTWTEGGADPRVWIKRQNANGSWALVGATVSQVDHWSKTPRIVSDANNRLYVAWAIYAGGQNPATPRPYAEINVAEWIFP